MRERERERKKKRKKERKKERKKVEMLCSNALSYTVLYCAADSRYLRILSRGSRSSSSDSVTHLLASSGISFTLRKESKRAKGRGRARRKERKRERQIEREVEKESDRG